MSNHITLQETLEENIKNHGEKFTYKQIVAMYLIFNELSVEAAAIYDELKNAEGITERQIANALQTSLNLVGDRIYLSGIIVEEKSELVDWATKDVV